MKKTVTILLVILIAGAIGLSVWGRDEPLSAEAVQLLKQPTVRDDENAYFSLLGFRAPADKNPADVGRQIFTHVQARQDSSTSPKAEIDGSLFKQLAGGDELRFSENVLSTCDKDRSGPVACIVRNRAQIEKILDKNKVMLERYITLLRHSKFTDPEPALVLLRFTDLQRAKFALWAKAVLLIEDTQGTQGLELLGQDTRFWRMLSEQSNTLLVRMIAVTMLRKQYDLLSQIVAYFPSMIAIEKDKLLRLCAPFSEQELNFTRAVAGELQITALALETLSKPIQPEKTTSAKAANWSLEHPIWRKTPLYRPNATLNLQAKLLNQWAAFSRLPAPRLAKESASFTKTLESEYKSANMPIYNRIGRELVAAWYADLSSYFMKVHDLDGLIRLVNLQIQIVAFKLPDERIGPFLQTSDAALTNPYSGEAMLWDAKERTLSFKARGGEEGAEVAVMLGAPTSQVNVAKQIGKGSATHSF